MANSSTNALTRMEYITHDQAQHILTQAKAAKLGTGQYNAAKQALERNDLEGFERVCRAIHEWLAKHGIDYKLTDGIAEAFYPDGTPRERRIYKNCKLNGPDEWFRPDGTLRVRYTYTDGKLNALAERFRPNRTREYWHIYKDGVEQRHSPATQPPVGTKNKTTGM